MKKGILYVVLFLLIFIPAFIFFLETAMADQEVVYVGPGGNCGEKSPCSAEIQTYLDMAADDIIIETAGGIYIETLVFPPEGTARHRAFDCQGWVTLDGFLVIQNGEASIPRGSLIIQNKGLAPVMTPDVEGMLRVNAGSTIINSGLTVGKLSEQSSATVPGNHVISQKPPAGTIMAPGNPVDLRLSLGPAPTITNFSASEDTVTEGETTILSWSTMDAVSGSIDNGVGSVAANGSQAVSPSTTTTYTLTVAGPGGTSAMNETITVCPAAPVAALSCNPCAIEGGKTSLLAWTSAGAFTCAIDNGIGSVNCTGVLPVSPVNDTTYTLNAMGPGGTEISEVTITVADSPDSLEITNCPGNDLTDISAHALTVEQLYPDATKKDVSGSDLGSFFSSSDERVALINPAGIITPVSNGTTNVTVRNGDLSDTCQVTISLLGNPVTRLKITPWNQTLSTEGETVQLSVTGVHANGDSSNLTGSSAFISEETAIASVSDEGLVSAVGNGVASIKVKNGDLKASVPVTVQILGTPVQGDLSGWINGMVTDSDGVPLEGVIVTMDGTTGNVMTDSNGVFSFPTPAGGKYFRITAEKPGYTYAHRTGAVHGGHDIAVSPAIVLTQLDSAQGSVGAEGGKHISADGEVEVVIPAGAVSNTINVRATNLDSNDQIPDLPETSDFLYCIKLDPDLFEFDQSVLIRIRNSLGFPPGSKIPLGIYSRDRARWSPGGMAVISEDGLWAEAYTRHFSFADVNSPMLEEWVNVLKKMKTTNKTPIPGGGAKNKCTGEAGGSLVRQQDGSLEERHRLPDYRSMGTTHGVELVYDSNRAAPRCPLVLDGSGDIDGRVVKNAVTFSIEGIEKQWFFLPDPETVRYGWYWDGINGRGQMLPTGVYPYEITLTHYFQGVYGFQLSFGGIVIGPSGIDGRQSARTERTESAIVGFVNGRECPYGAGWNVAGVQRLYLNSKSTKAMIVDGSGIIAIFEKISEASNTPIMDGLYMPFCAIADGKGGLFIGGWGVIIHVDAAGQQRQIAGTGPGTTAGDNGFAEDAKFNAVTGMHLDSMGNLYFADPANHRIRRIDTNGIITTVAGTEAGFNGDGGPATRAMLNSPRGVTMDQKGNMFIADTGNNRIRQVDALGRITTVAGSEAGYDGDGSPSVLARLNRPYSLVLDKSENLFIADYANHCIRKISPDGIISTFAGKGPPGGFSVYPGDGAIATQVEILEPVSLAVGPNGSLYAANFWIDNSGSGLTYGMHIMSINAEGLFYNIMDLPPSGFYYNYQMGICYDGFDKIYIANPNEMDLFMVSSNEPSSGSWTTCSGAGDFSKLTQESDGTFSRHYRHGEIVTFDADGFQTSVEDTIGNATLFAYSGTGENKLLKTIADPVGKVTTFSYSNDKLSTITNPAGRVTAFQIDTAGNLVSITNPDLSTRTFTYDADHRMTGQTDAGGATTRYIYDGLGCIHTVTFADESQRFISSEFSQAMTNLLDPGTGTESNPAPPFRTSQIENTFTDATGKTKSYEVNRFGVRVEFTNELKQTSRVERNVHNLPSHILSGEGKEITAEYNIFGLPTLVTLENTGAFTEIEYDTEFNLPVHAENELGHEVDFDYDAFGNLTKITDQASEEWLFTYDFRGLLTAMTNPAGETATFSRNADGNVISVKNHLSETISFEYDDYGNIERIETPGGRITTVAHNVMNLPETVTDPSGNRTRFSWDMASGTTSAVHRTPLAVLRTVTDHKEHVTTIDYNERYMMVRRTDPLGRQYEYTYDGEGFPLTKTDPLGRVTEFTYDDAGNLVRNKLGDGTIISRYHNKNGRLVKIWEPTNQMEITYDIVGRITGIAHRFSDGSDDHIIEYEYDSLNRLTRMNESNGTDIAYIYDDRGLLTSLNAGGGNVFTFANDSARKCVEQGFPNGVTGTFSYDGVGRIIGIDFDLSTGPFPLSYEYDATGRVITMTDAAGNHDYRYDDIGQVISATHPNPATNPNETYVYDAMGNRTSSHLSSTYILDDADQLTEDDDYAYGYDDNGNCIQKGAKEGGVTTSYTYDARDRITKVDFGQGNTVSFEYDVRDRLISRANSNGDIRRYRYNGHNLVAELNESGSVTAHFVHSLGVDHPLMISREGQDYFFHQDRLGSTIALSDSSGGMVNTYTYDVFGRIMDKTEAVENPFTYTGRRFDEDLGMYYYRARWYDPFSGRFLSRDPLGSSRHLNLYSYVFNNPLNFIDPLGLEAEDPCVWFGLIGEAETRIAEIDSILSGHSPHSGAGPDFSSQTFGSGFTGRNYGYWRSVAIDGIETDVPVYCRKDGEDDAYLFQYQSKIGEAADSNGKKKAYSQHYQYYDSLDWSDPNNRYVVEHDLGGGSSILLMHMPELQHRRLMQEKKFLQDQIEAAREEVLRYQRERYLKAVCP